MALCKTCPGKGVFPEGFGGPPGHYNQGNSQHKPPDESGKEGYFSAGIEGGYLQHWLLLKKYNRQVKGNTTVIMFFYPIAGITFTPGGPPDSEGAGQRIRFSIPLFFVSEVPLRLRQASFTKE